MIWQSQSQSGVSSQNIQHFCSAFFAFFVIDQLMIIQHHTSSISMMIVGQKQNWYSGAELVTVTVDSGIIKLVRTMMQQLYFSSWWPVPRFLVKIIGVSSCFYCCWVRGQHHCLLSSLAGSWQLNNLHLLSAATAMTRSALPCLLALWGWQSALLDCFLAISAWLVINMMMPKNAWRTPFLSPPILAAL